MSLDNEKDMFEKFKRTNDRLLVEGRLEEVIKNAQELLSLNPQGFNHRSFAGAYFIDCSEELNDLELAELGISLLENLLEESQEYQTKLLLKYNLSNGYSVKDHLLFKQGSVTESQNALRQSQALLQELLLDREHIELKQLSSILVNYANSLDRLGRPVEAIDYYYDALKTYPSHPNALGNCGLTIHRLLRVSPPHVLRNAVEALRLLTSALGRKEELIRIAGLNAVQIFENHLDVLKNQLEENLEGGLETVWDFELHRYKDHRTPQAPRWLSQINHDRLLLSMNLNPLDSVDECKDDLYFRSIQTEIRDNDKRFQSLIDIFNTLKEDFATARYLFYLATQTTTDEIMSISAITSYGSVLGYADYGLSTGLLKASFRLAADCFDKIALFLNVYFKLGHKESKINFNNIWFDELKPKTQQINPILENSLQMNLYTKALRELQKDWFLQRYPGPLRDARHSATHRTLILYKYKSSILGEESKLWHTRGFKEATFLLLRMVKAALIYLICMVTIEEDQADDDGITPTLFFTLE